MRKIKIYKGYAEFDEISAIDFYNDEDELLLRIDPLELSALYGAWMQMQREIWEKEKMD